MSSAARALASVLVHDKISNIRQRGGNRALFDNASFSPGTKRNQPPQTGRTLWAHQRYPETNYWPPEIVHNCCLADKTRTRPRFSGCWFFCDSDILRRHTRGAWCFFARAQWRLCRVGFVILEARLFAPSSFGGALCARCWWRWTVEWNV